MENHKIPLKEKLCYTSGNLSQCLINNTMSSFLLFFFTDISKIPAASASLIFMIGTILNIIIGPVVGTLSDQTRTKLGCYRPWVMYGGFAVSIISALCFVAPPFGTSGRVIWAGIAYVCWIIAFSAAYTPYGVMNNVMTEDTIERGTLATFRETGSDIAGMVVGSLTLALIGFYGHGQATKGYTPMMITYAVCSIILIIICVKGTKERLLPVEEKSSIASSFGTLKGNRPAIIIYIAMIVMNLAVMMQFSWVMYYCTYCLGNGELTGSFISMWCFVAFLCKFIIMPIIKKMGKRNAMIIGSAAYLIDGILFLAAKDNMILNYAAVVFFGIGLTVFFTTIWGALPDVVEYGEYVSGIRAPGFLYSLGAMFNKVGNGLSGVVAGLVLTFIGYNAAGEQTARTIAGIRMAAGVPLIIAGLVCIILFVFYNLSTKEYNEVVEELNKRREKQ